LVESLSPPDGISVRYWRNGTSLGLSGSLNKLFAEARGRRLVLMNDDDALLPEGVAVMAEGFSWSPDVLCAYSTIQRLTPAGEHDPAESSLHNTDANTTPEQAGLRRDLLVCALWRQVPPVGFMLTGDAARRVGYADPARVGYALDTEFGIRLALAYRGRGAFAFIGKPTAQYRFPSSDGLTRASKPDMFSTLWRIVADLPSLSPDEADARDGLLRRLAHVSTAEHALARRRRDALRILLSRHYPYDDGALRPLYALRAISNQSASCPAAAK
jgi:hypothetical protein